MHLDLISRGGVAVSARLGGLNGAAHLVVLVALGLACRCDSRTLELGPQIAVSPTTIDFGLVAPMAAPSQTVTVKNTGRTPLTLSAVQITGTSAAVFSLLPSATSVSAGASLGIVVFFNAPASGGPFTANLNIHSNATNAPLEVVTLKAALTPGCASITCPDHATCALSDGVPTCTCDQDTSRTARRAPRSCA
jgi:hypothetical protein